MVNKIQKVAFGQTEPVYCSAPPFHPDTNYPECKFSEISDKPNKPYGMIRELFLNLGLDAENYGTSNWNPLKNYIAPGTKVVIKPNYVLSYHPLESDVFSIITHPSILRAMVDYAYIALGGDGRIIIADAPQMDCNWNDLMDLQRLDSIAEFYKTKFNFHIEYYDLRNFELINNREKAYYENRRQLPGDPEGNVIINLGKESKFYGLRHDNYYGADLNRDETISHHHDDTHEYSVSGTILSADTVISVPKLKVHKKVGVTLNIKGLVGINTNKNYLVHYRVGRPSEGGDQLPDGRPAYDNFLIKAQRYLYDRTLAKMSKTGDYIYKSALFCYNHLIKPFRKVSESTVEVDSGNWYGNDSAWRMAADLARIFYFADADGRIHNTPQRKVFSLIDGIVAGENRGPLLPDPKNCGLLIAGDNFLAVDMVASRIMGFNTNKIRTFDIINDKNINFGLSGINGIEIISHDESWIGEQFFRKETVIPGVVNFVPHPGWIGHIEL
jgi:uncharacterized protein (DUF362 family)